MQIIASPNNSVHDTCQFKTDLVAFIPQLRAFARSLCGDKDNADDLAQETLARAWQARRSFIAGTNFRAWLFTILRNRFYSDRRRAWRSVSWNQVRAEMIPSAENIAEHSLELSEVARALESLPDEQREALILVGAAEFSYAEAACICRCAIGTIKSRVARARRSLTALIDGDRPLSDTRRRATGQAMAATMTRPGRLAPPEKRLGPVGVV
jgi:RNA polymerase sigma-70 factor (ECF subfamily)